MAKFYGNIGYADTVEVRPGYWKEDVVEYPYSGDVLENKSRWNTPADKVNDDLTVGNRISIIADPYANQNFHKMKYVEFMGTKWKITTVDATTYPRLLLSLGGVYNGEQT